MALLKFLRRLFGQDEADSLSEDSAKKLTPPSADPAPPANPPAARASVPHSQPASEKAPPPQLSSLATPVGVAPTPSQPPVPPVRSNTPMPLPAVRPVTGTPPSHSTLPALERARPAQPQTLQPPPTPQLQRAPTPPPQASEPQEAGVEQSQHRRLAVRDERLAQKLVTTQHAVTARRPSKRSFHRDEAARMFSSTLRTQRRGIRDLVTDEQQLVRYGLPIWRTEAELALALQVGLKALRHYTVHRAQDRVLHYVTFAIPKRSGGERLITAPKTRLKALQRRLNALLVSKLPVSEYAHGFRTGHSVLTNAKPHVGKQVVLRLDIHEFFPSIHFGRVRGLFLALGYGYPVATALAVLMTEAPRQPVQIGEVCLYPPCGPRTCPQGAPTSPGLSNALLVRLDRRLAGLAKQRGFSYTRYADDLTFSGDDIAAAHALRLAAARVVREEGFELNVKKTRVARRASRQLVTGVIVNRVLGLSRQTRRRLRAAVHQYLQAHAAGAADPRTLARLDGRIAYLSMLNSEQARRLTMD